MSDSILPPTPAPVAPAPRRNHNRNALSGKPKRPPSLEEREQIITMSAAGVPKHRIAKTLKRDPKMVKRVLADPDVLEAVSDERTELVEIYRDRARACVIAIDDEKIAKSSALQLATSSGILLDKSLLLSGQPTSVNVVALMDVAELIRERRDGGELARQQITGDGQ